MCSFIFHPRLTFYSSSAIIILCITYIKKTFFLLTVYYRATRYFQKIKHGETYPCDTCGRQYRRIISLQRHKRLECGKEAQFQCSICNAKFKHKHSLLRHYNVHTVMKSEFQDSFI
ncbi:hypothetical protein ACFW04_005961 [Cataglyphis niger]